MAGERTLPGLGLTGYWDLGSDGWKDGMDANLLALSAVGQLSVQSRTAGLPGSPANGDRYIVPSGADADKVAVRDNDTWVYFVPVAGWRAYVEDEDAFVYWNGLAWTAEPMGEGGGEGGGGDTAITWHGARRPITDFTASTPNAWNLVTLGTAAIDTDGFSGANRFVIPAGVTRVRLTAYVRSEAAQPPNNQWGLQRNGVVIAPIGGGFAGEISSFGYNNSGVSLVSGMLEVSEGDEFALVTYLSSVGGSVNYDGWFQIEVLEGSVLGTFGGGGGDPSVFYEKTLVAPSTFQAYDQEVMVPDGQKEIEILIYIPPAASGVNISFRINNSSVAEYNTRRFGGIDTSTLINSSRAADTSILSINSSSNSVAKRQFVRVRVSQFGTGPVSIDILTIAEEKAVQHMSGIFKNTAAEALMTINFGAMFGGALPAGTQILARTTRATGRGLIGEVMSQTQYDGLASPDPDVFYFITE